MTDFLDPEGGLNVRVLPYILLYLDVALTGDLLQSQKPNTPATATHQAVSFAEGTQFEREKTGKKFLTDLKHLLTPFINGISLR